MKCDDFISNNESRSPWSRLRARVHANRCPTCAATREWLTQVRRQLATSAEITPFHRRVWERAAAHEAPDPTPGRIASRRFAVAGGLALAAALVVAFVLSLPKRDERRDKQLATNPHSRPASTIVTQSLKVPPGEIAALETGLDQLEADLKRLSEEAARLETLRAISELAAKYQPLNSGDST
jgi:hypothetical protein